MKINKLAFALLTLLTLSARVAHAQEDAEAARLLARAALSLEALARALDPAHTLPLAVAGSIAQRLLPQLSPAIAQRVVPAKGDAMDGALALCFE